MLRQYATVASRPSSRLRARGKTPVGLDHVRLALHGHRYFMAAHNSISSYNDSVRWLCGEKSYAAPPTSLKKGREEICDSLPEQNSNNIVASVTLYVSNTALFIEYAAKPPAGPHPLSHFSMSPTITSRHSTVLTTMSSSTARLSSRL
jgi:hypothetical protein